MGKVVSFKKHKQRVKLQKNTKVHLNSSLGQISLRVIRTISIHTPLGEEDGR